MRKYGTESCIGSLRLTRQASAEPSACARVTPLSGRPIEKAMPALVVASALKPRCRKYRADPASQGLGMTKQPLWCNARKSGEGIDLVL